MKAMIVRRLVYIVVPLTLVIVWAAVYLPWERQHRAEVKLPVERLPEAVFVWNLNRSPKEPPEVLQQRRQLEDLQKDLITILAEEANARLENARRAGGVIPPPGTSTLTVREEAPNQHLLDATPGERAPTEPSPSSGAPQR